MDFSLPSPHQKATFDSLYSEVELHRAALQAYTKALFSWRKALSRSHDGRTLYDFARHTPQHLERLHRLLARHQFQFREGLDLHYNFNGKHRTIYLFPWEERIVDLLLYRILNRNFHTAISADSYAYRFHGFGVDLCEHRIARRLSEMPRPLFVIKRDIADFFPSIDHDVLLAALAQWIQPDDYLYDLVRQRVQFKVQKPGGGIEVASRGVPFGTAIACFFANFYLTPLDREMSRIHDLAYFRYADDLLLFSSDKESARLAGERIQMTLEGLRLSSKASHERDFRFPGAEGQDAWFPGVTRFRHLGLEFRADGSIGLSRDKGRKIRNLFRFAFRRAQRKLQARRDPMLRTEMAIEIAKDVVESRLRSVAIIDYYLKHVDDEEQLRQLDRWLAEEVLALAFGTGHRKGNFRNLSFVRLREMGLPSLRHRHRLLRHGHLKSSFFKFRTERLIEQERRRLPGLRTFSPHLEAAAEPTP